PRPQTPAAPHPPASSPEPPHTRPVRRQLQRRDPLTQHPLTLTANGELTTQDTVKPDMGASSATPDVADSEAGRERVGRVEDVAGQAGDPGVTRDLGHDG